uniref:Uncharacterized protein n=1 Tax=Triticum urartu TaxID=4572 RepID=A0A8R7NYQ4_TRIUA
MCSEHSFNFSGIIWDANIVIDEIRRNVAS